MLQPIHRAWCATRAQPSLPESRVRAAWTRDQTSVALCRFREASEAAHWILESMVSRVCSVRNVPSPAPATAMC